MGYARVSGGTYQKANSVLMIKMEKTGNYKCSLCKGDLIPRSNNPLPDGQIWTHFQCLTCQADHYYTEKPYVAPPNNRPDKPCKFCGKLCEYYGLADDWQDYWKCDSCQVHYSSWLRGLNEPFGESVEIYTRIKDKTFCLRQYMPDNKSRLEMVPDDPEDTLLIIKDFDHLFPDVTPSNIQEKLPIYILF